MRCKHMVCHQCDDELVEALRAENKHLREAKAHEGLLAMELKEEVEQFRLALAGAENSIRAEQMAQEQLKDDIKQLMKETAERQREACAAAAFQWARTQDEIAADKERDSVMASAEMHREEAIMARRISAAISSAPLVTDIK